MPKFEITFRMDDPKKTFKALSRRDDGTLQQSLRTVLTQAFDDKTSRETLDAEYGITVRETRIIHDEQ